MVVLFPNRKKPHLKFTAINLVRNLEQQQNI